MTPRILLCVALAACHGDAPAPAAPAKPIAPAAAPAPAPAPAPPDTGDRDRAALAHTLLAQVAQQALTTIDRDFPAAAVTAPAQPPDPPDRTTPRIGGDLLALGPCTRPTPDERAAIAKQIAAAYPGQFYDIDGFGCVDPAGTIVDVETEISPARGSHAQTIGVWAVLRGDKRGKVATLAEHRGTPMTAWSEWSSEITIGPLALVDLDGDGEHDAILERTSHEGGSQAYDKTLSAWLSRTRTTVGARGAETFSDSIALARGQIWAPGKPVVVEVTEHTEKVPRRYRCIEPSGAVDICPAVAEARRVDDAVDIAGWFVAGDHEFAFGAHVPHHDELVALLDVLHTPQGARAQLLAAVPPTTPGMRVAGEIARALAPEPARKFGELLDTPPPVDPRPAQLMAVLGDAPCPAAGAAAIAAAIAKITAYAAAHDRAALVAHADCPATGRCRFAKMHAPEVFASCIDERTARGYFAARWSYEADPDIVMRDAVMYVDAKGAAPVALATATGQAYECPACGGRPPQQLDPRFVRHGATLVALVRGRGFPVETTSLVWAADGAATEVPATDALDWYAIGDDQAVRARDVVQLEDGAWHWDGTWQKLPAFTVDLDATDPPADATGAWLWHEAQRQAALRTLAGFDPDAWSDTARATTLVALALAGIDAPTIARIAAIR